MNHNTLEFYNIQFKVVAGSVCVLVLYHKF